MNEANASAAPLLRLRQLQPDLPPTARRIAAYIQDHPDDVIRMSITELAEQAGASEGSIVALCRRIGASGFQELKILLARDLVAPAQFIQEDLQAGDSLDQVSDRIFAAHASTLSDTRKLLSTEALTRAVEIVRGADRVEVYGIGSSGPIAVDLAYRLLQLGLRAAATTDSHIQAVNASLTGPEVAVVTVSHSGSTRETLLATRLASEAGARVIGITRLGRSPLQRFCEVVLHTVAKETRYRTEAMSSRVAQLAIVDTLVSCCAIADPERSAANLQRSARVIGQKRF